MRNLKKFLALVLAMMMVMGLMVTVNAATTDDAADGDDVKATYKEAVDVMLALNLIAGTNTSKLEINPDGTLTRAELVTMMYQITTANSAEAKALKAALATDKVFDDVKVGDWYTQYVNYAYFKGWVGGYGDGSFGPNDKLKVADALSVVMNVLGNRPAGLKNDMDVLMAAANLGLTKNVDAADSLAGNASRQLAFQLFYDAMKWSPKGETSGYQIDGVDEIFSSYYEAVYVAEALPGKSASDVKPVTTNPGSLLETVHGVKDGAATTERDDFGRPTTVYKKADGTKLAEVKVKALNTYKSGEFTGADAKALDDAYDTIQIYYNGDSTGSTLKFKSIAETSASESGMWVDETTGKNGYEMEVYEINDTTCRIIVREAYVAKVGKATDAGIPVTAYVSVGTSTPTSIPVTVASTESVYAALAGHEENDYVAVYVKSGQNKILDVAELTPVTAKITSVTKTGKAVTSSITAGGVKYGLNYQFMRILANASGTVSYGYPATGDSTLYLLDEKVLLVDQTPETETPVDPTFDGYAIVLGAKVTKVSDEVAASTDVWGNTVPKVPAVFSVEVGLLTSAGEPKTYSMKVYAPNANLPTGFTKNADESTVLVYGTTKSAVPVTQSTNTAGVANLATALNGVYAYSVDDDNVVTLTALDASAALTDATKIGQTHMHKFTSDPSIDEDSTSVAITGGAMIDSSTKFILKVTGADGKATYVTKSVSELGETDFSTTSGTYVIADVVSNGGTGAVYVARYIIAPDVEFDTDDDSGTGDAETEYVYVTGGTTVELDDEDNEVTKYNVIRSDGTKDALAFDKGETGNTAPTAGEIYALTEDGDLDGTGAGAVTPDIDDTLVDAMVGNMITVSGTTYNISGVTAVPVAGALKQGAKITAVIESGKIVALWVTTAAEA